MATRTRRPLRDRLRAPLRHRQPDVDNPIVMPVADHIGELRRRIIWVVSTLVVFVCAGFAMADWLFAALNRPLDGRFEVMTLGVTEPFFTTLTVAAWTAFALTLPLLVFHAYRFVAPALAPARRQVVRRGCLAVPGLFAAGVLFTYAFILGPAVRFLLGLGDGHFDVQVRASDYYSFVSMTLVAVGLAFLYPLALMVLGRLELVTAASLRENRRLALLAIAVLAALLPTADPVSLLMEMLPLVVLYEVSILLVAWQQRRAARSAG